MATALWDLAGDTWSSHRHDGTAVERGALTLAAGRAAGAFEASLPEGAPFDPAVLEPGPRDPMFRGIVDYMNLAGYTGGPGDALVNLDRYLLEKARSE